MRDYLSARQADGHAAIRPSTGGARSANAAIIVKIRRRIEAKNRELLKQPYFQLCRTKEITRAQVIDVIKQVYCFSFFFERLLTRRIAECSHDMDERILELARAHLRDELGHVQLFQQCLNVNGVTNQELSELKPKTFTKAVFGYLLATIQHENEYVSNLALMQVMESIGCVFFAATQDAMQAHGMIADAMVQHTEDDADHAQLGLELLAYLDEDTLRDCDRIIEDLYRLMALMFDDWMRDSSGRQLDAPRRKRRSSRPPRAN
jgi:hypothetical protein